MKHTKRFLAILLALIMILSCLPLTVLAAGKQPAADREKTPAVKAHGFKSTAFKQANTYRYADNELVRAIVVLEGKAAAEEAPAVRAATRARIAKQHNTLRGAMSKLTYTELFEYDSLLNGIAVETAYGNLDAISAMPGVRGVYIANHYDAPVYTPAMESSNEMTALTFLHEMGELGSGAVIAILDTGMAAGHEAFAVYDDMLQEIAITEEDALAFIEDKGYGAYVSDKIPFSYDYADEDNDAEDTTNGHGVHVSGIAAGYAEEEDGGITFCGSAPDAQLLEMKIFHNTSSGTSSDIYFAALEDAYELGADVINMSIGSQNGFTFDPELENEVFGNVYKLLDDNGVICCVSAGNEYSMSYNNSCWAGDGYVPADYPDYGVLGSPSSYDGNMSVASVENEYISASVLQADGLTVPYYDNAAPMFIDAMGGKELPFVACNYGMATDFAEVDVAGAVALICRGEITFQEKVNNAAEAGAVAAVIFNNTDGVIYMSINDYPIPAVSITRADGEELLNKILIERAVMTFPPEKVKTENESGWLMSDFSSWGCTPSLTLKPTISGIGGNVYSASYNTADEYEYMSGTSMAAPNVSGFMATLVNALAKYAQPVEVECASKDYTDVKQTLWYHEAVDYAISEGYMGSTKTDALTFEPNTKVSRAMVASIMYRIAGTPAVEYKGTFTDVKAGKWFTDAIEWAAANGLASGKGDGKFDPNGNVTRQELASFMFRFAGYLLKPVAGRADLSTFADGSTVPSWATAAMQWAVDFGIISGKGVDGAVKLAPKDNATRAEFASIIMRFMGGSYEEGTVLPSKHDIAVRAECLAESTAMILHDDYDCYYSPRKQGAGLINAAFAAMSPVYLEEPILNLYESADGEFNFTFTLKNYSETDFRYAVNPIVLTDNPEPINFGNEDEPDIRAYNTQRSYELSWYGENDIPLDCEVTFPETVDVPAFGTAEVAITIKLTKTFRDSVASLYPNGIYIEGFIELEGLGSSAPLPSIHATYMGFYGNWTSGPILEQHDWREIVEADSWLHSTVASTDPDTEEEYTYADLGYTWMDLGEFEINTDINAAYAANMDELTMGFGGYCYAGDNPYEYVSTYNEEAISISSAEDAMINALYMTPMNLRNCRHMIMVVTDAETGEVYYVDDTEYLPKVYFDEDEGVWSNTGVFYYDGTDADGEPLPDGTEVVIDYFCNIPYGDDALAIPYEDMTTEAYDYCCWSFRCTIDNTAPTVNCTYDKATKKLTVKASDNRFLSALYVEDVYGKELGCEAFEAETVGKTYSCSFDLSECEDPAVFVYAYDYTANGTREAVALTEDGKLPTYTLTLIAPEGMDIYDADSEELLGTGRAEITVTYGDDITIPMADAENHVAWIPKELEYITSGDEVMDDPEIISDILYAGDTAVVDGDYIHTMTYYALFKIPSAEGADDNVLEMLYYIPYSWEGTVALDGYDWAEEDDYILAGDLTCEALPWDAEEDYIEYYDGFGYYVSPDPDKTFECVNIYEDLFIFVNSEGKYLADVDGELALLDELDETGMWYLNYYEDLDIVLMQNSESWNMLLFNDETLEFELVDPDTISEDELEEPYNLYLYLSSTPYDYYTDPDSGYPPEVVIGEDSFWCVASEVFEGAEIAVVATYGDTHYAMTSDNTTVSNALNALEVPFVDGVPVIDTLDAVWTVCEGNAEGTYRLKSSSGDYINWSGSGTGLSLESTGEDLNITCGKETSKVVFDDDNSRGLYLRVNNGVPQFRGYKDTNSTSEYSFVITVYLLLDAPT